MTQEPPPFSASITELKVGASDKPPDSSEAASLPDKPHRGSMLHGIMNHGVALILAAIAIYFILVFNQMNAIFWRVFPALRGRFEWGMAPMEWGVLGWSAGAVVIFTIVGWFFLESLELYLPRWVVAALAFTVGFGLTGIAYELIAMAGYLIRPMVFVVPASLMILLWPFAIWAARRRPETGFGGDGGAVEQTMRREQARSRFERTLIVPSTVSQRVFWAAAIVLLTVITLLIFYHALLYPETYWDSLILYLGYARMMYHEGGIVTKVMGQVGIGLGANYPHLYSLLGAAVALAAEQWSELPQRLLAPLAGLASTVLVYHTVLRLTRHVNFSLSIALLFRSIPHGIIYNQYASDYALAILFTAAFLYVALLYIQTALKGYFILATLLIALGMHLNYLMGILWLPWAGMIAAAHGLLPSAREQEQAEFERENRSARSGPVGSAPWDADEEREAPWTSLPTRRGLFAFLASPVFLLTISSCGLLASTWYIRNWVITGNPVYAFFSDIFGGKYINPEVMESAEREWSANGAGIVWMGPDLKSRILNTWYFFVNYKLAWRLQPFLLGFVFGGMMILIARALSAPFLARRIPGHGPRFIDFEMRFGLIALLLTFALFAFHYVLAPFYLYQIIMVLPALAVVASFAFPYWRLPVWRWLWSVLVIAVALMPGVAMSLAGFKITGPVRVGPNRLEHPIVDLVVFRHPMPDPELFYSWRFGEDAKMWRYINQNLQDQKILTHENRHLVFDPSITLIHLDDWEIQQLWFLAPNAKIKALKEMGIRYYLKVPNEEKHGINKRMGTIDWPGLGFARLEYKAGENLLYRLID